MTRVSVEPPLIESAVASGRYVEVTTYHDGATAIRASLLFKTSADAATVARILRDGTRPAHEMLADIAGPASREVVGNGSAVCDPPTTSYDNERSRTLCHLGTGAEGKE